ncbi:hypothetical protein MKW92_008800, partial [Papaver armeniacum]
MSQIASIQRLQKIFVNLILIQRDTLVTHQESLKAKVNETKAMVKFQLKKVLCMSVVVGDRRRTAVRPPQVLREGTKKTVFVNFMDLCKRMNIFL